MEEAEEGFVCGEMAALELGPGAGGGGEGDGVVDPARWEGVGAFVVENGAEGGEDLWSGCVSWWYAGW